MTFFNKKEDVIEIQLTQYGKHLLSKGKFKPAYYSFFDDDVLYDAEYAGYNEKQNDAQPRIEDITPRTKTQYVFSSREKEVRKLVDHVLHEGGNIRDASVQSTPDKHYALSAPLGTSDYIGNKAPSFSVTFLRGTIGEYVTHLTGAHPTMHIPQLAVNSILYTTQCWLDNPPDTDLLDPPGGPQAGGIGSAGSAGAIGLAVQLYDDGSYIEIKDDWLLVEAEELNVPFTNENFDVEVFLVEDVDAQGNLVPKELKGLVDTREMLHQLSFVKHAVLIDENDILLDEPEGGTTEQFPEIDPSYVEYWFNLWVDSEIDEMVLCADAPVNRPRGIFTQDALECAMNDQDDVPTSENAIGGSDLAKNTGLSDSPNANSQAGGMGNDLYDKSVTDTTVDGDGGDDC
jgi:hypothetical protein